MKKIIYLSFVILVLLNGLMCNAQLAKKETNNSVSDKVEVYYFHMSTRCVTCKAVEAETKKNLESLYGGNVTFQSMNIEAVAGKAIAEKLKISGQTLLIVKGNTKINLTNEGFMYARNNPARFKSILKEKVDGLLK